MFAGFHNQSPLLTRWFHLLKKWPQRPEPGIKDGFEGIEHEFRFILAVTKL